MSAESPARAPAGQARRASSGFDPLRTVWGLLINVKFALLLVGLGVVTGLAGTVFPQVPAAVRNDPPALSAWMEARREDFGPFTGLLERLGFFDLFHTPWFTAIWATIIVAVSVCTVSRLRPTYRNIASPPSSVSDAFFDSAVQRITVPIRGDLQTVTKELASRRFRIRELSPRGETRYLLADRVPWADYGTFVSHLALLILLIGALFTFFGGFSRRMVISEGTPAAPVLAQPGPGQIFVRVVDAFRGIDAGGNIVDFHTNVEVRRGEDVVSCRVTVNSPCGAFGYRVHQAAFFDDFAALRVIGGDGALLFDDVLDFGGKTTIVPHLLVVAPSGEILADEAMPQLATDFGPSEGREDDIALGAIGISPAGGEAGLTLDLAWKVVGDTLRLTIGDGSTLRQLAGGDSWDVNGYHLEFVGPTSVPAVEVSGFLADPQPVTFQLIRRFNGSTYLLVSGLAEDSLALLEGSPRQLPDGSVFLFAKPVEGAGLDVRRDPGDTFIWIGVALGLAGLAMTFYLPRRRLWVRIEQGHVTVAARGERAPRIAGELQRIGDALAARSRTGP